MDPTSHSYLTIFLFGIMGSDLNPLALVPIPIIKKLFEGSLNYLFVLLKTSVSIPGSYFSRVCCSPHSNNLITGTSLG